eukprot:TRINITY_DN2385_c1_g3_i3.p1 TRINITY_DN2385_c1_g3~~TRINITY_DN2385_c1_g3_i3.p1  ORF type:complete len:920 (+),score=280.92 TRINITY_DN2385_c1_g3_i3:33-2762(+)
MNGVNVGNKGNITNYYSGYDPSFYQNFQQNSFLNSYNVDDPNPLPFNKTNNNIDSYNNNNYNNNDNNTNKNNSYNSNNNTFNNYVISNNLNNLINNKNNKTTNNNENNNDFIFINDTNNNKKNNDFIFNKKDNIITSEKEKDDSNEKKNIFDMSKLKLDTSDEKINYSNTNKSNTPNNNNNSNNNINNSFSSSSNNISFNSSNGFVHNNLNNKNNDNNNSNNNNNNNKVNKRKSNENVDFTEGMSIITLDNSNTNMNSNRKVNIEDPLSNRKVTKIMKMDCENTNSNSDISLNKTSLNNINANNLNVNNSNSYNNNSNNSSIVNNNTMNNNELKQSKSTVGVTNFGELVESLKSNFYIPSKTPQKNQVYYEKKREEIKDKINSFKNNLLIKRMDTINAVQKSKSPELPEDYNYSLRFWNSYLKFTKKKTSIASSVNSGDSVAKKETNPQSGQIPNFLLPSNTSSNSVNINNNMGNIGNMVKNQLTSFNVSPNPSINSPSPNSPHNHLPSSLATNMGYSFNGNSSPSSFPFSSPNFLNSNNNIMPNSTVTNLNSNSISSIPNFSSSSNIPNLGNLTSTSNIPNLSNLGSSNILNMNNLTSSSNIPNMGNTSLNLSSMKTPSNSSFQTPNPMLSSLFPFSSSSLVSSNNSNFSPSISPSDLILNNSNLQNDGSFISSGNFSEINSPVRINKSSDNKQQKSNNNNNKNSINTSTINKPKLGMNIPNISPRTELSGSGSKIPIISSSPHQSSSPNLPSPQIPSFQVPTFSDSEIYQPSNQLLNLFDEKGIDPNFLPINPQSIPSNSTLSSPHKPSASNNSILSSLSEPEILDFSLPSFDSDLFGDNNSFSFDNQISQHQSDLSQNEKCYICYVPYVKSNTVPTKLRCCNHSICKDCLSNLEKKECPFCRSIWD